MLPLIRLCVIDSTQSFLARHPQLGFCGVMADAQTAGRGRGKNSWESKHGSGLWLSVCLPLPGISKAGAALPGLTNGGAALPGLTNGGAALPGLTRGNILQAAMTAVIGVLSPLGLHLGLKWPNDLVAYEPIDAGNEKKAEPSRLDAHDTHDTQSRKNKSLVKIGGIIGEQRDERIILGLGLNVLSAPDMPERTIRPSSLVALGAKNIPEILDLAMSVLSAWENLETWRTQHQPAFLWPESGDAISWEDGNGICQEWASDGRLAVLTKSGLTHLASGDISGSLV